MKRFLIMIYACLLFNGNVLAGTKVRVEMQPNSFENPTKPGIPWMGTRNALVTTSLFRG